MEQAKTSSRLQRRWNFWGYLFILPNFLGFLLFNAYPAKVFMGDTGSLALGGFVAAAAYMMQLQLFIPIIGFIYRRPVHHFAAQHPLVCCAYRAHRRDSGPAAGSAV